jgi:hypothetical protein
MLHPATVNPAATTTTLSSRGVELAVVAVFTHGVIARETLGPRRQVIEVPTTDPAHFFERALRHTN